MLVPTSGGLAALAIRYQEVLVASLFHFEIVNQGATPIEKAQDYMNDPSETATLIEPGQTGDYQAESDGGIPVIGSIMTGTAGRRFSEEVERSLCLFLFAPHF